VLASGSANLACPSVRLVIGNTPSKNKTSGTGRLIERLTLLLTL
jgi:hypothetical protein